MGKMIINTCLFNFCQVKGVYFNYNQTLAEITLLKQILKNNKYSNSQSSLASQ